MPAKTCAIRIACTWCCCPAQHSIRAARHACGKGACVLTPPPGAAACARFMAARPGAAGCVRVQPGLRRVAARAAIARRGRVESPDRPAPAVCDQDLVRGRPQKDRVILCETFRGIDSF